MGEKGRDRRRLLLSLILMFFIFFPGFHKLSNNCINEYMNNYLHKYNLENTKVENSHDQNYNIDNGSSLIRDIKELVKHETLNIKINGLEQVINILEVKIGIEDIKNQVKIKIKPILSHDSVYGFELLSEMITNYKAYAAINAGFFYEYGQPSGMVLIDGEIITCSTGKYPVFTINEGKAQLRQQTTELYLKSCTASNSSGTSLKLNNINLVGKLGEWTLYTNKYGLDNRIKQENITIIIEDNIVIGISQSDKETKIPKDGMLATYILPFPKPNQTSITQIPFNKGDKVEFEYKPNLGPEGQAYECGSWLVKDKKVVAAEKDPWVGVLTNRDPRTAIGIKESGEVILITVDGRQPGYSYGLTAQELGEFLIEYKVKDAALLDGGASTEMIIDGKIINRPSFRSSERPLGGAIIIEIEELAK